MRARCLPCIGRKSTTGLPVADTLPGQDGDGANLAQPTSARLVNIDHSWKFRCSGNAVPC